MVGLDVLCCIYSYFVRARVYVELAVVLRGVERGSLMYASMHCQSGFVSEILGSIECVVPITSKATGDL